MAKTSKSHEPASGSVYRWVIDSPLRLAGVVGGVVALAIIITLLVSSGSHNNTPSSKPSSASGSGIKVVDEPDTQQDTLAQWKANPQYQNPLTVSYEELFRNSDKYKGQFVRLKGQVIQVLGDPGNWNLRVNVTPNGSEPYVYYVDTVYVFSYSNERVIDKDIIEFTAQANGVYTYQSTFGSDVTIPSLTTFETPVVGRGR